jgi:immunoglobulin I-set domain protein/PA14 domain-containing protein/glycosyl hydrolase family 115/Big-like domain-containing protein
MNTKTLGKLHLLTLAVAKLSTILHRGRGRSIGGAAALLLALLIGWDAVAQVPPPPPPICVETNCLPPAKKKYGGKKLVAAHQQWGEKVFARPEHEGFTSWDTPPPPVVGASKTHTFGSSVRGLMSFDNGVTFTEVLLPANVRVRTTHDHMEGDTQVLLAEIEAFDIYNASPPLQIRQSPSSPSSGITTVRPVSGGYAISSFFDVYTDLSVDGGATWTPSSVAGRMELTEGSAPPFVAATDTAPPPRSLFSQPPTNWPVMFSPNVLARNFSHRQLPSQVVPPTLGQSASYGASGTIIEADISTDGGATYNRVRAQADVAVQMRHAVDAGESRFFDTEILSLNIQGGSLPPNVMLRESPTLVSAGEYIIRRRSHQGSSGFQINSYFDVNLELSTDNGQNWTPASGPVHLDIGPGPANILFVSDNPDANDNSFLPPLVGFPDDFYVIMLQNAGHNVIRFNPPAAATTLLTAAQLAAINTNDLIIVSRSINSGAWTVPQSSNWNTRVTIPLIMCSPYLVRPDGGRLGWFTGGTLPDTVPPTYVRAPDVTDPETDFLFADVAMSGDTMVDSFDEPLERNTSTINNPVVTGGKELALIGVGSPVGSRFIAEFPMGTVVRTNADILSGYRMYFSAGSREADGVPIPLGAGRDNLTPAGEKIFMRAVELALLNGQAPHDPTAPVGFQTEPASITVVEGTPVTFSVRVRGAPPRWVEWQRDQGDGTYTNVPGAATSFKTSEVRIPRARLADHGAAYRVVATNNFGIVTSQVATLTVLADTTAPTIIAARPGWTMTNIFLTFSEPVDRVTGGETFNYNLDNGLLVDGVTLDSTGTKLVIHTTLQAPGIVYTVTVNGVLDLAETANMIAENTQASFTAFVDSPGFLVSELFTGITFPVTAGNDIPTVTTNANYPHYPSITSFVNVSSNAPTSPNLDSFGGRLVGWVVPPLSGTYTFYIRGDDDTELRLNGATIAGPVVTFGQAYSAGASQPQTLNAGQAYFVEALWRDGTGGDFVQVAWTPPWSANIEAIAGAYLRTFVDGTGVSVSITAHPQGSTVFENRPAILTVSASSTPAGLLQAYQWQKGDGAGGFTNALGLQYGATFATPLLKYPDDNGSQWRAIVYVPGGSATSDVATVTVEEDVEPPQVVSVVRLNGSKTQIRVEYNEAMDSTALDAFSYALINQFTGQAVGLLDGQSIRIDDRTVILIASEPLADNGRYKLEFNGPTDLAENPVFTERRVAFLGPIVPSGAQNLAVFEAEDYDGNLSQGGSSWVFFTGIAGYSGVGAMDSTPNTGRAVNEPAHLTSAPRLDYRINFSVPGTYYVWARGYGRSGNDDSAHIGLDGASGVNYNWRFAGWGTTYSWQRTVTASPARVDVPSAGVHTFNFWMREDGIIVDKFLLTTDSAYTPTGAGPVESVRATLPPVQQRISIARSGDTVTISWPISANLQEADDLDGEWTVVATGVTSHDVQASAAKKFYRVIEP